MDMSYLTGKEKELQISLFPSKINCFFLIY